MDKFFIAVFVLALFYARAYAQQKGAFTDPRDKKVYKTAKIGEQTWMAENLNYSGENDDIGKCYNKKPANCKKYGALYSWHEAIKVCPEGWHLPSDEEWQALVDFAGGERIAGKKLKAKSGWSSRGNGTDDYGFAALPGGDGYSDGDFDYASYNSLWWSSSEFSASHAYDRYIIYSYEYMRRFNGDKSNLYSVRCLQD